MAPNSDSDRGLFLERAINAFQENVRRSAPAAVASYTLIAAIVMLDAIGYIVDTWLATNHWSLLVGLLLGLIVGFVELAKAVWPASK